MVEINMIVAVLTLATGVFLTKDDLKALYETVFKVDYISLKKLDQIIIKSRNNNSL